MMPHTPLVKVVEVEDVSVEVCEDVFLVQMLLAVQRELLAADRTLLPVGLDMTLETALLEVWRENHLTKRTALMDISPSVKAETGAVLVGFWTLMITDCWSFTITSTRPFLGRILQTIRRAEASRRLAADYRSPPWGWSHRRGAACLLRGQCPICTIAGLLLRVRVSVLQLRGLLWHQWQWGWVLRVWQWIPQHHRLPDL